MNNCIVNELVEKEMIHKNTEFISECQNAQPFILLLSNGSPFVVTGRSQNCFFETVFFLVKSVNEETQCAVLELLFPCPPISEDLDNIVCVTALFQTMACITVDLSCFCGIVNVNIPVFECLILCDVFKDTIRCPFLLTNTSPLHNIWTETNETKINNTATITVQYTNGTDPQIEVIITTDMGIVVLPVLKGGCRAVTLINISSVSISAPAGEIEGTVEIQLNRIERREIHF